MKNKLNFKVSAALKDIIGRDLITDEYIAIFELVKNSYDARATRVDIFFESLSDETKSKIIIMDNGKGMDYDDLKNKWLFVAYSAKKEGTEDSDYRDKIQKHYNYAGAKGIGRFSCDRLGRYLRLETIKKGNSSTEVLLTNWEKFEENLRDEFVDIEVSHSTQTYNSRNLEHGTILEVTGLRSTWERTNLLKLKSSLSKLINPKQVKDERDFSIYIHSEENIEADNAETEDYKIVNGEVKNFIFETLGLKTTKIHTKISEDRKYITTELLDGGTLVYSIKEFNKYDLLENIETTIFYLNMSAKQTFSKRMGLSVKSYGHIFLYKNGFRVYPYGEPGEDPLKIDVRKAQGHNRYLGTREIIGQIEIFSDSNELKETSSRGDGLIKTPTYLQMEECFWEVLKRLEKYVVEVQNWGLSIEVDNQNNELSDNISNLISKLSGSSNVLEVNYSLDAIKKTEVKKGSSADAINKIKKLAFDEGNDTILDQVKKVSSKFKELENANHEIEKEKVALNLINKEYLEVLKLKEKENELLKEASSDDKVELMSIEHHVNQATYRIDGYIKNLHDIAKENKHIENEIVEIINNLSLENKKIASLVKFVSSANFDLLSSEIVQDLARYIEQYVRNVYKNDKVRRINKQLVKEVSVINDSNVEFKISFVPLLINIILDNLLDNSHKASAQKAEFIITYVDNNLIIDYIDNGIGINKKVKDTLFNFGVTTTLGSGIGLYHIKKITNDMDGDINLIPSDHGAHFKINIPYKKP